MPEKGIGLGIQRKDAQDKVCGATKYTMNYTAPRLLHASLLTSPHAHAKIKLIDTSVAETAPGVKAVITGNAYPGLVGVLYEDRPIIAKDKDGQIRCGFSGLCSYPFREQKVEEALNNMLTIDEKITDAITSLPENLISDQHGSAEYRQFILVNALKDILAFLGGEN